MPGNCRSPPRPGACSLPGSRRLRSPPPSCPPPPRTPSSSVSSPPCRASRPNPARRSCAGSRIALDEINAKGGLLGKKVELLVRDDESNPAKGVDRRPRTGAAREGRRAVRRPRHAGLDRDRAVRQPGQGPVHGRVGGGNADHPQRRGRKLRVPRLRRGRSRRQGAGRLRDQEVRAKKPGMILINNPWGESNEKGLKAALDGQDCPMRASRSSRPTTSMSCRSSPASSRPAPTSCSWSPTSRRPRRS